MKPTYNAEKGRYEMDGIEFDGHFLLWKFEYNPQTYLKDSELSGKEWRKGGTVRILLNGDCVYREFCRTEDMALTLITKNLYDLKCHFELLSVNIENWKSELVGKKVYHAGVPSIIKSYDGDGEITLITEDGKPYEIYGYKIEEKKNGEYDEQDDEWVNTDRVHITDPRIWWYRKHSPSPDGGTE